MLDSPSSPVFIGTEGISDEIKNGELVAMSVDLQNYGIMFTFQPAGEERLDLHKSTTSNE